MIKLRGGSNEPSLFRRFEADSRPLQHTVARILGQPDHINQRQQPQHRHAHKGHSTISHLRLKLMARVKTMIAPANTLRAPKRSAIQLDSGMKIATARMQAVMPMFMSTGVMPNALAMVGNAVVMTEAARCT